MAAMLSEFINRLVGRQAPSATTARQRLQRVLGDAVMTAVERLMGLILTAIAIEMLLAGVRAYVASIP